MSKKVSVYLQQNFRDGKKKYKPGQVVSLDKETAKRAFETEAGIDPKEANVGNTTTGVVSMVQYKALEKELEEVQKKLSEIEGKNVLNTGFLDDLNDDTLGMICKDLEIEGYSKLKKAEKAKLLKEKLAE